MHWNAMSSSDTLGREALAPISGSGIRASNELGKPRRQIDVIARDTIGSINSCDRARIAALAGDPEDVQHRAAGPRGMAISVDGRTTARPLPDGIIARRG